MGANKSAPLIRCKSLKNENKECMYIIHIIDQINVEGWLVVLTVQHARKVATFWGTELREMVRVHGSNYYKD